jgi:hypothetical protein
MRLKLFLMGFLFSALVFPGPVMAESKGNFVELGMLDTVLKEAEGTAVDAFAHEENRIDFDQPGVQKYDDFFKKVAIVSGTVTELRFVLNQIGEGKLGVAEATPVIDFGLTTLPKMEDKIPSLIDRAEAFNPADDFPGFRNKMKVPGVVAGLADATTTLTKSATEIPGVLQELKAIATPAGP